MKNKLSDYEAKVLRYLFENDGLTTREAVVKLHIMNVQDVVMRLRRYDYNIDKRWLTSKKQKRYAQYYLVPDYSDNIIDVDNNSF